MPDNSQQWNPVAEFKQQWPNAQLSDGQILQNLQDPAKFRSAFPHYTGVTDDEIKTKMQAYSPMDMPAQPKGDVRPSTADVLQKTTGISAHQPTTGERLSAVFAPFMEHVRIGGAAKDERLVAPVAYMTPTEQSQHPMLRAALEFFGGLTTAPSLLMLAGGGGLAKAAPVLSKALNFAFSEQMLQGAYEQYAPLKEAWDKGDEEGVKYHLTHMLFSGAFGLHTATEGMSTDPGERFKVKKDLEKQAKLQKNLDPNLNKAVQQARAVDQSTPLGPISETGGQQLQLDFTAKAPVEAQAPATSSGASKSGSAPIVNRQALIAPEPTTRTTGGGLPGSPIPLGGIEAIAKDPTAPLGTEGIQQPVDRLSLAEKVKTAAALRAETGVPQVEAPFKPKFSLTKDAWTQRMEAENAAVIEREIPGVKSLDDPDKVMARLRSPEQGSAYVPPPEPVVSAEPPVTVPRLFDQLKAHYDMIADLGRQADQAENDSHAESLTTQKDQVESISNDRLRDKLQGLSNEDVKGFRDQATQQATRLDAQSKAIRDLTEATVKNRGIKNEIADLRSQGGPVRSMVVDPETGERAIVKPEEKAGRGGRSVLDELQGRVPTSDFSKIEVAGKPEGVSDTEWADHVSKLQEERTNLKAKISHAVTIASETGASVADMGIEEHVDRLKQIESLLGKYAEPGEAGRRPNIPAELDEQGAVKAPEALKSWTLERARLALGAKVNKIPTDEEFFQHADMRAEKARLLRGAADIATEELKGRKAGERGAVGEGALPGTVRGEVKRVSLKDQVPADDEIVKRAKAAKIFARTLLNKSQMGEAGFLSKDGSLGIDSGNMTHDDVAQTVLPEIVKANTGSALRAMLEKGWIRKANFTNYEAWNLDSTTVKTIEHGLLEDGRYGHKIDLDTRRPSDGRMGTISLEAGWDEKYKNLQDAVDATIRKKGWGTETGAVRGATLLGSASAGAVTGAVIGAHIAGPVGGVIGGAIGWGAGFITPGIVSSPKFWSTLNGIKPAVTGLGIDMADWLRGTKQLDPVNPDMTTILDAQRRDVKGPTKSLLTRVAQLPGDISNKMFDKFVFINDRPGAVLKFLMSADERGAAFRDLRGKLSVENSPYVSAWLAAGGGGGMAEAHLLDYKKMFSEAQSKGLVNNVNEYLNLKGYQRVYDVMSERIQEADQNIQQLTQALQQPNLHVEVEAGMKKALREATAERQDVIDKLTSKTLVPQPYDPPKIANDLQAMQAQLGPKFQDVQALAGRVFDMNRKVLDMVHDAGIVGDAEYQKYVSRGNEYIPMHRILEQVSDNTAKTSGKGSPLYLRQQNVIKALMGSDRINRDPVIASADANLEAIREVTRNGVIKDYLKVAAADPQGVGSYFKQVSSGYRTGPDEGLVGVYENGQQHTFAAPKWLSESLKNVSPSALDVIGKGPLQTFGQILRKGATMGNLAWSVPNALRHLGDMAIMSDAGLKDIRTLPRDAAGLVRDWTKSVYGSITHDPVWQEYMRSGAAYSTLQRMISPEDHLSLDSLGFKQKIAHGRIIDVVQDFNAAVEDATKMTTYRRLREAGYSEKNAAWETRRFGGGPDFAKQGNLTPAINLVSMFFNAHLQYVSRVFARAAENPARVAVALGAITAMAMTLNEHNVQQKDDSGNQLLRKVPYTDRENNFVVLTGDTYQSSSGATLPVYYKVPKPSFVKFLYNPIENMLNKVAGREERSGVQLGLQALGNLSPGQMDLQEDELGKSAVRGAVSSLNPIIKAPLEEAMNYKTTGMGGPIVPGREQNIDPRFQFGPGTSQVAQRIGQGGTRGAVAGGAEGASIGYLLGGPKGAALGGALGGAAGTFGISPRRAEHVIDTTTAGVGRIATGFVDPFLGGVKQTHMEGPEKLANTPVGGPIMGRFVATSIDQQEQNMTQQFYSDAQKAQQPMATIEFLKKNHPEQIPDYIESHKDDLWKAQVATQMQSRLGVIQNAQKTIEQSEGMTDADRTSALKNLHEVKMQVLSVFTKVLRPGPQVGQASAFPGQGQGSPR